MSGTASHSSCSHSQPADASECRTELIECADIWGTGCTLLREWGSNNSHNGPSEGTAVAPLVVLLHGAGQNSLVWVQCAQLLVQRGFHVFAFDFRGHGDSTVGEVNVDQEGNQNNNSNSSNDTVPTMTTFKSVGSSDSANDCQRSSRSTVLDLSMDTLVADTAAVIRHILKNHAPQTMTLSIIGHSLGGAVAVHTYVLSLCLSRCSRTH